jgi:hypothetical protein
MHDPDTNPLRNANITVEEYEFCSAIWRDKDMESFRDWFGTTILTLNHLLKP